MAKEIIDIYIEQGYEYDFVLDYNLASGGDLESDYTCYFHNDSVGTKQFSVISGSYSLTLTEEDTGKITNNLESYVVYVQHNTTQKHEKLLSGRIHLDKKARS